MNCRFCKTPLTHIFIDLGSLPAANSFVTKEELNKKEQRYPLKVYVCHVCFLVQVDEHKNSKEIFSNTYAYFSSYSSTWLIHMKKYAEQMIERFGYSPASQVVELASNDGYLLQYFAGKNIPVLGIEPAANTAQAAIDKGIPTIIDFFGVRLAKKLVANGTKADLLIGNNVLAHVPDIIDFVAGMKILLQKQGVITLEFPHLMQLIEQGQFDTIYHEHFSYLSFHTVRQIFASQRLELFDVEELPTHGGSLRIYARHTEDTSKPISSNVSRLLKKEQDMGMRDISYYGTFQEKAERVKVDIKKFLLEAKKQNKIVAAYGAAAKGNTLLTFCDITDDLIKFVVDLSPHKQGKYLPGSHIPIVSEEYIQKEKPDYVMILPWNLKQEIVDQLSYIRGWQGRFVTAMPHIKIW